MKFLLFIVVLLSSSFGENTNMTIHGFGTIGTIYQGNKDVIYRSSSLTDKGSQGDLSFATDSRFGLQLDYDISKDLKFTVQGAIDSENATLEWANFKYNFTHDTNIKLGKMRMPASMYTDILKVGYSYPWVRLTDELYGILPLTSYWGVELNSAVYYQNFDIYSKIFAGYSTNEVIDTMSVYDYTLTLENIVGIELKSQIEDIELKFTYLHTDLKMDDDGINTFFDTAIHNPLLSVGTVESLKRLNPAHTKTDYVSLGAKYDDDTFFIIGEYVWIDMDTIIASNKAAYITAGVHLGKWTPHLTYSKVDGDATHCRNTVTDPEIKNQLLEIIKSTTISQDKYSAGIRYEYDTNIAIKFQYDHIEEQEGGRGISIHLDDEYTPETLSVFSLSVDFIF